MPAKGNEGIFIRKKEAYPFASSPIQVLFKSYSTPIQVLFEAVSIGRTEWGLGHGLGDVIRIVEKDSGNPFSFAQSNVLSSDAASFDSFRTIKKNYFVLVRFEIMD